MSPAKRTLKQIGDIAAQAYMSTIGMEILEHPKSGEFIVRDEDMLVHVSVVIAMHRWSAWLRTWWVDGRVSRPNILHRYRNQTYTGGTLRLDIITIMPTAQDEAVVRHRKVLA